MKPSAPRKIGLLALVAATYAMVAGGPFGLDEIVANNGYSRAILILCITPLLWAVPTTRAAEPSQSSPVGRALYLPPFLRAGITRLCYAQPRIKVHE